MFRAISATIAPAGLAGIERLRLTVTCGTIALALADAGANADANRNIYEQFLSRFIRRPSCIQARRALAAPACARLDVRPLTSR